MNKPRRRFTKHGTSHAAVLRPDHPAVTDGRTLFRSHVEAMNRLAPNRCAIRFSTPDGGPMTVTTIERPGIICPVQTGRTDCCGTCGLCWSPAIRGNAIIFLDHGRPHDGRQGEMDLKGNGP